MRSAVGLAGVALPLALIACAGSASVREPPRPVSAELYEQHIARLAADEFEGRKPATPGEEKTLEYLTDAFRRLGLEPAAGSSYLQPVPLVEITASADARGVWRCGGRSPPRVSTQCRRVDQARRA